MPDAGTLPWIDRIAESFPARACWLRFMPLERLAGIAMRPATAKARLGQKLGQKLES